MEHSRNRIKSSSVTNITFSVYYVAWNLKIQSVVLQSSVIILPMSLKLDCNYSYNLIFYASDHQWSLFLFFPIINYATYLREKNTPVIHMH